MPASSLFNMFGKQTAPMMNNGFFGFMNQFNQFKNNFQGDPRQQVQQLLDTGQMSQQQFNQLSQTASQFQQMMNLIGR